eukprot:5593318-Amphidinium_carterae.1
MTSSPAASALAEDGWVRLTFDTGKAVTAFPLEAEYGHVAAANGNTYKTASAEVIGDEGGITVKAASCQGDGA